MMRMARASDGAGPPTTPADRRRWIHSLRPPRVVGSLPRRVLALDYGLRRIGVARSDPTGTLATPVSTLVRRRGKRPPFREIGRLADRYGAEALVVGLPLDELGEENEWAAEVRGFGARLEKRCGLPVFFADEHCSSVEAEARIRSTGLRRGSKEEKGRIDAGAAAIILQDWLDSADSGTGGFGGGTQAVPG